MDDLEKRFNEFKEQETQLFNELDSLFDRFVDEYKMTRCQVAGVLMDMALGKLGRPVIEEDEEF